MVTRIDAYQCDACGTRFFHEASANKHAASRPEAEPFSYDVGDTLWANFREYASVDPFQARIIRQYRLFINHANVYDIDPIGEIPAIAQWKRPFTASENELSIEEPALATS